MDIKDTTKKAYVTPKLTERGSIEQITQGVGELGSGDMIFRLTKKDGCKYDWSPLCDFGS